MLVATTTPDEVMPNAAPLVAHELGAVRAGAFDIGAACTGFLSALAVGTGQIEAGRAQCVLVIGADFMSRILDPAGSRRPPPCSPTAPARSCSPATSEASRIGPIVLGADGAGADHIKVPREEGVIRMRGHETFREAVARLSLSTVQAVRAAGIRLDDIDLFVYHQANGRILSAVGERLSLPADRVVDCIAEYGNTSAATLPLALAHVEREGRLKAGHRVLLGAFGAGFTWGATVVEWGPPPCRMSARVVITGVGAVTPLGVGARELYDGWIAGRSGIEDGLGACTDFDPTEFMTVKEARRSDRFAQLAIAASAQAVADAGWDADDPPADPADLGCVIGSGIGGMWTFESQCDVLRDRGPERVSPLAIPLIMGNAAAGLVAMRHGLRGPVFGVMSACASGTHAIGEAARMIRAGEAQAVVTGGAEATLTPLAKAAFAAMEATSPTGHLAAVRRAARRVRDGRGRGRARARVRGAGERARRDACSARCSATRRPPTPTT